jgi:hypothetical protein
MSSFCPSLAGFLNPFFALLLLSVTGGSMNEEHYFWHVWMYGADDDAFDRWDESTIPYHLAFDMFSETMRVRGTTWYAEA